MRYVGGKVKISSWVVENLLKVRGAHDTYLEPFMGGAAVLTKMVPHFSTCLAGDSHPDLIAMWLELIAGWNPPTEISAQDYESLKTAPSPSALKGLVGFGASWGGKYFGGYVDTVFDKFHERTTNPYLKTAVRSMVRDAKIIKNCYIDCRDFADWNLSDPALIYCDPPYLNTLGYSGAGKFDWGKFNRQCKQWVSWGHTVVVSESRYIEGTSIIAERTRKSSLRVPSNRGENTTRLELLMKVNQ